MRGRWITTVIVLVAVAALSLGVAYYLGQPQPTDQQRLYRHLAQAQQAANAHNARGLTALLSRDYADRSGTTRQQMVAMIVQWMRGGDDWTVVPEITDLQLHDDFADMRLRVRLWHGREPTGPGEEFAMAVRWRREGRAWKVISAEGYAEGQGEVMNEP
jgi:hypothetical protein